MQWKSYVIAVTLSFAAINVNAEQSPITIYTAKKIITVDPVDREATAVAVKDGRIYAVGSLGEMQQWMKKDSYTVNNQFIHDVITPGLIEPHTHFSLLSVFMGLTYIGYWDFPGVNGTILPAAKTKADVLAKLKEANKNIKDPNQVLFAWGYDPIYFDNSDLTAADLDTVSKTRPIFVLNASMHIAYINSVLINKMGYNAQTKIPGVEKNKEGQPNGVLKEMDAAGPVIMSFIKELISPESFQKELYETANIAQRLGVTTVADMLFGGPGEEMMIAAFKKASADDAFPERMLYAYNGPLLLMKEKTKPGSGVAYINQLKQLNNDKLYFGAIKFVSDGSIQGFTSRLNWPGYFNGAPNGLFNMDTAQLKADILPFWQAGFPIHVHVNGDQATDAALDALEYLQTVAPRRDGIYVLEHNQMAAPESFQRAHRLGAYADLFSNHIYYWGDQHYSILLGPDRANRMDDPVSAMREHVPFTLHTDSPVTPMGPLHTMWSAMNRVTASGRVLGAQSKLSASDALRAVTFGAATILNLQKDIGSIEVGKRADFTVLGQDPLLVDPMQVKDIPVLATMVNGRIFPVK